MTRVTGVSYSKTYNNSVGVLFCARSTGRQLFLLRNGRGPYEWGLPGGKVERGETLLGALQRECREELNTWMDSWRVFPIEQFTNEGGRFIYHTFYCPVEGEFTPILNHEHIGYCWVDSSTWPKPLHRGLFNTLNYSLIQQKIAIIRESTK